MRTLACFEFEGVLDGPGRPTAVARQALRNPEWTPVIISALGPQRGLAITRALDDRLGAARWPKPFEVHACGNRSRQLGAFTACLTRQALDRVLVFDHDVGILREYVRILRERGPARWTVYRVNPERGTEVVSSSSETVK